MNHRVVGVLAVLLLGLSPGSARSETAKPKSLPARSGPEAEPPPPLNEVVARATAAALGVPVSIKQLVYNLFTSSFEGRTIRLGKAGGVRLSIPSLSVKMAWFSGGAVGNVQQITLNGLRLTVPVRRLGHRLAVRLARTTAIARTRIRGANVRFVDGRRTTAALKGVTLSLHGLTLPASGDLSRARGRFSFGAGSLILGKLQLRRLVVKGSLSAGVVRLSRVSATMLGGSLVLSGTVSLRGNRLGAVKLAGSLKGAGKKANLGGEVTLSGPNWKALTATGRLKTSGRPLPRARGKDASAPRLKLNVRVGKRRLSGTLTSWKIR